MTASPYRKRPRVGDVIDGPTGPERVVRVYANGVRLDIVDRLERSWQRQRARSGWWLLAV
jgi:hypothetical protein